MSSQPWYIYILECSDKTLYVGISNNVKDRVSKHNSAKGAKYTRGRLPVKLLYQEEHIDKSSARKREIQLKKWSRKKKFLLINKMLK